MSEEAIPYHELLLQVTEQLSKTPSATDHLMLTRWRVLSLCQYLLGDPERELEDACRAALEIFVSHGPGDACDTALKTARAAIRRVEGSVGTVLPSISAQKRAAVRNHLDSLAAGSSSTIDFALRVLPTLRERVRTTVHAALLPGIRHRLELVAEILEDHDRGVSERLRAAATVVYVYEVRDVLPDTLGVIGMIDDDYALRMVLEDIASDQRGLHLHWSEKISFLWDDLPFLQGVNLKRGDDQLPVNWLDRLNSYVSYTHVLRSDRTPLVLLQPSIACSPLHSIVSLIGLLVLDAVTSSQKSGQVLREGQTYELDKLTMQFDGFAGPPVPGWLRLRLRDGVIFKPPALADRMIPIGPRRLSSLREFSSQSNSASVDPMQRFFDWDAAIAPTAISSRLVLVASRERAQNLLDGIQSNGVQLLDHGLVRFVGEVTDEVETHGTLILVVPSLAAVRLILERGVRVQAVVVDGYERLYRGRHELPFLVNRNDAPPIINWSAAGYYPPTPPAWLPLHRRLEVTPNDLGTILELEDGNSSIDQETLWEAATGVSVQTQIVPVAALETALSEAIEDYLRALRDTNLLPDYWRYYLGSLAKILRILIASTPAKWSDIKHFAIAWTSAIDEKSSQLRPAAVADLTGLRDAERKVTELIRDAPEGVNSRAVALETFLSSPSNGRSDWLLVCDRQEQMNVATSAIRTLGLRGVRSALLRDVAVCSACVVVGWVNSIFARRLWSHTPKVLVALTNERDSRLWKRSAEHYRQSQGHSLLSVVNDWRPDHEAVGPPGHVENDFSEIDFSEIDYSEIDRADTAEDRPGERVPCVFLWIVGKVEAKVLAPDARVIVQEGETARERVAASLRADDRVILGHGTSRWSPADEFTSAVIDAVESSQPELVACAREWRMALRNLYGTQRMSISQLRDQLSAVGVRREDATLEGWLDVERAFPIAPRGLRTELAALWSLVERYTNRSLDDVVAACTRLRSLRVASSRILLQLWKGRYVLGVNEGSLGSLLERLSQEVQSCEIEAITSGEVPKSMFGWWISSSLAKCFELTSRPTAAFGELEGEDDPVTI